MEWINVVLILGIDFLSVMLVNGKPDPPKDVRIVVTGNTINISWTIPTNQGIVYSRIYLKNSTDDDVCLNSGLTCSHYMYIDIESPKSSTEIPNLERCSKYIVRIQCLNKIQEIIEGSNFTTHTFWVTNNIFKANINENIVLLWTTNMTEFYSVLPPSNSSVIYEVEASSIQNSSKVGKYIFDQTTTNLTVINITVTHVNETDAGLYTAVKDGIVDGCCLLIVTNKPLKPTLMSLSEHPFVGDNITFACKAIQTSWPEGYMAPILTYHFVGNPRGEIDNNQLTINTLTKLDKGQAISCRYTDEYGEVSNMSDTITLDPYYGPENVVPEPGYTHFNVTEGTLLGPINCTATCNPECTYVWKHEEKVGRFNRYLSMQPLTIPDIKRNQTGNFRCRIDYPYANTYERTDITVNVQYSPEIKETCLFDDQSQCNRLNTTNNFNFSEDVNVSLLLRIDSNPDPKVMLNSSFLAIQNSTKGNGYIEYIYILPHLKCEDSGEFTIRAINGIANGDTKKVNLTILCKPRNVTTESRKIETKVGSAENIVMYVVSSPLPTVEWCRVTGFDWIVNTDIYDYRYEIMSEIQVRSELDFGVYGITICNQEGCIDDNITLKPRDKPEAPQNLSVESVTFVSVNLSWIAGFNGGYNQTFKVQFKTTDTDIWNTTTIHTHDIKTGSVMHVTLDQLKPDTSYEVMVLSTNIHGNRNASLEFKTEVKLDLSSSSKSASNSWLVKISIGFVILVLLVVVIVILVVFKIKRQKKDKRNGMLLKI
ncbi:nephrin-like [Mytilus galloprovincialis]|uniref:nephrin-like n=1 Tax=Mytilus galloprovincialis TaxID=29158 RepID=UPI003F7CBEDB